MQKGEGLLPSLTKRGWGRFTLRLFACLRANLLRTGRRKTESTKYILICFAVFRVFSIFTLSWLPLNIEIPIQQDKCVNCVIDFFYYFKQNTVVFYWQSMLFLSLLLLHYSTLFTNDPKSNRAASRINKVFKYLM